MWYGRVADLETITRKECASFSRLKDGQDLEATTIGTTGEKDYDGFLYAVRK